MLSYCVIQMLMNLWRWLRKEKQKCLLIFSKDKKIFIVYKTHLIRLLIHKGSYFKLRGNDKITKRVFTKLCGNSIHSQQGKKGKYTNKVNYSRDAGHFLRILFALFISRSILIRFISFLLAPSLPFPPFSSPFPSSPPPFTCSLLFLSLSQHPLLPLLLRLYLAPLLTPLLRAPSPTPTPGRETWELSQRHVIIVRKEIPGRVAPPGHLTSLWTFKVHSFSEAAWVVFWHRVSFSTVLFCDPTLLYCFDFCF